MKTVKICVYGGVLQTNDFLHTNFICCYIISFPKTVPSFWTGRLLAVSEIFVPSQPDVVGKFGR